MSEISEKELFDASWSGLPHNVGLLQVNALGKSVVRRMQY
jgi:hypothetical protein